MRTFFSPGVRDLGAPIGRESAADVEFGRPLSLQTASAGFTLVELAVVVLFVVFMACLLAPALAKTKTNGAAFQCLNNHRQLTMAWRMYAEDAHDHMLYASDDGSGTSNPLNQYAWTQTHLDSNPANRANWDITYLKQSPLWPYCNSNALIWRCPSDRSYVVVNGNPRPRIRSVGMNLYLGGYAGTDGGWGFASNYRIYFKTSELSPPGPARVSVLVDLRPDSVTWSDFFTPMTGYYPRAPSLYSFGDFPGSHHSGMGSVSFADNHAELPRWRDPRTMAPGISATQPAASPNNQDIAWLQDHSTRPK
jgi:hypothetical protein